VNRQWFCTIFASTWAKNRSIQPPTCISKVITAPTEDYKALMQRELKRYRTIANTPVVICIALHGNSVIRRCISGAHLGHTSGTNLSTSRAKSTLSPRCAPDMHRRITELPIASYALIELGVTRPSIDYK
jgi:hypothetical protein